MKRQPKNSALESQVKSVIDDYVMGQLRLPGKLLTATTIAAVVSERHGIKQNAGGVHNILVKWERIGFITFVRGGTRPLTFESYTDAARDVGLSRLKEIYYLELKAGRDAQQKAERDAVVEPEQQPPARRSELDQAS